MPIIFNKAARTPTMDRRITIQRVSVTSAASGEPEESWATIVSNRPAAVTPVIGSEMMGREEIQSRQQVKFEIRWSLNVADLSPLDRVVYPADRATDSPTLSKYFYDILAVNEIGRHEYLQLVAARQPDVP